MSGIYEQCSLSPEQAVRSALGRKPGCIPSRSGVVYALRLPVDLWAAICPETVSQLVSSDDMFFSDDGTNSSCRGEYRDISDWILEQALCIPHVEQHPNVVLFKQQVEDVDSSNEQLNAAPQMCPACPSNDAESDAIVVVSNSCDCLSAPKEWLGPDVPVSDVNAVARRLNFENSMVVKHARRIYAQAAGRFTVDRQNIVYRSVFSGFSTVQPPVIAQYFGAKNNYVHKQSFLFFHRLL